MLAYVRQTSRITLSTDGLERNLIKAISLKKYGLGQAIENYKLKNHDQQKCSIRSNLLQTIEKMQSNMQKNNKNIPNVSTLNLKMKIEIQKQVLNQDKGKFKENNFHIYQKPTIMSNPTSPKNNKAKQNLLVKQPSQKAMKLKKGKPLVQPMEKPKKPQIQNLEKTLSFTERHELSTSGNFSKMTSPKSMQNKEKGNKSGKYSSLERYTKNITQKVPLSYRKSRSPSNMQQSVNKNQEKDKNHKLHLSLNENQMSNILSNRSSFSFDSDKKLVVSNNPSKFLTKKSTTKPKSTIQRRVIKI